MSATTSAADLVFEFGALRRSGPWRLSSSSALHRAFTNKRFRDHGLFEMETLQSAGARFGVPMAPSPADGARDAPEQPYAGNREAMNSLARARIQKRSIGQ